jgi:hypothetical protein
MSFPFSRRKFIDGGGVLAASSFLSPPRLRFGSVHLGAPMKPEELRARLRGGIAFPLRLSKILFSGFHQRRLLTPTTAGSVVRNRIPYSASVLCRRRRADGGQCLLSTNTKSDRRRRSHQRGRQVFGRSDLQAVSPLRSHRPVAQGRGCLHPTMDI